MYFLIQKKDNGFHLILDLRGLYFNKSPCFHAKVDRCRLKSGLMPILHTDAFCNLPSKDRPSHSNCKPFASLVLRVFSKCIQAAFPPLTVIFGRFWLWAGCLVHLHPAFSHCTVLRKELPNTKTDQTINCHKDGFVQNTIHHVRPIWGRRHCVCQSDSGRPLWAVLDPAEDARIADGSGSSFGLAGKKRLISLWLDMQRHVLVSSKGALVYQRCKAFLLKGCTWQQCPKSELITQMLCHY